MKTKMQDIINNSEVLDKLIEKMLNEQLIIAKIQRNTILQKKLRLYLNDDFYDIVIAVKKNIKKILKV